MHYRKTTIITIWLVMVLCGLGYARTGNMVSHEIVLTLGIFFLISYFRRNRMTIFIAILFGFTLGWVRGQAFLPNAQALQQLDDVTVTAIVTATSDTYYNSRGQLTFDASSIRILSPSPQQVSGKMTVSGFGESAIFNGDTLEISGRVYTTRGSKQLGISFAQIRKLSNGGSWVDDVRRRFTAGIATAVPEPANSLGIGLLIGQRSGLPDYIEEQLSIVGLTHIVAVSGYNLTILVNPIKRLLRKRSKYQIVCVSFGLIIIFLLMTGFQASIVRAGLVSGLSITAWYYGRSLKPLLILSLSAALTAWYNPYYIWSDIGWYLSFLAFFGILVVAPALQVRLFKNKPKVIGSVFIETLSATLMTLPLIMFIFGRVSLVSLPANIFVVPLVPFAMLFSAIAGVAGMIIPTFAGTIGVPANILMTAMLDIVYLFSRVPYALQPFSIDLVSMLVLYASLLLIAVVIWKKHLSVARITE